MAQFGEAIDTDEAVKDYKSGFSVVPPGWYTVVITESEVKDTSTGGKMVVLKNELQDGSGRSLPDRLNIVNKSEIAQKIGRATLAKIAKYCGVNGKLENSDVLHGRPFDVKIVVEKFKSNKADESGNYPMLDSNKITDYRPKGEGANVVPETSSNKEESVGW